MKLKLKDIAAHLESLEEKIIFKLLIRAQYKLNSSIYKPGKSGFAKYPNKSLFDIRFEMQEKIEAKFGRYSVPEERPFTIKKPVLERVFEPYRKDPLPILSLDSINLTKDITQYYLKFVKSLCQKGSDKHFGSSVESDVYLLQSIAERIHYGAFFVAESKYQMDPKGYQKLIDEKDMKGLEQKLRRVDVERKILKRIKKKVNHYQKHFSEDIQKRVDPEVIARIYEEMIIPLTIKGELMYFEKRINLS